MKIYLASSSPRRAALLKQIDVAFEVIVVDIDEHWDGHETPEDYVCRMSLEKARAGSVGANLPVLAADTAVILDGMILGKATDKKTALSMLTRLSDRTHTILSAVSLIARDEKTLLSISKITFKSLTKQEIDDYCATDEPIGKAGGYAIQGKAAVFIKRLDGSYSGVMGLPLFETARLLKLNQNIENK